MAAAAIVSGCGERTKDPHGGIDAGPTDVDAAARQDSGSEPDSMMSECQFPGQLDASFGMGGVTGPIFGLGNQDAGTGRVNSVAFDVPTSRILVGGAVEQRPPRTQLGLRFAIVALRPDGNLDPTFGFGGRQVVGVTGYDACWLSGIALQSDGKIVGAGGCSDATGAHFALVRFHADGTVDTTFGNSGTLIDQPEGLPLGSIVAAVCVVSRMFSNRSNIAAIAVIDAPVAAR